MKKFYRRRRLAALALVLVAIVVVLVLFGTLGTQASTRVQGDQLGPDGESRAEYIERVNSMDIDPDAATYALVTFDTELPPVAVAAAVTDIPR